MNVNRYVLASLAVLVWTFVVDMLVHGTLLRDIYMATQQLWRPESEFNMPLMMVSQLLFSLALTYVCVRYSGRGFKEGLLCGVSVGLIFAAANLGTFVVMPVPFTLTLGWMLGDLLRCAGAGVVVAVVYKK